ncbi:DNA-binding protein [Orrella sp. JC864]|uniref:DNA-binding protein n=1 Tax=Orrella sp. JC864 TaxID=3120298 RepID=UPI00300B9078
MSMSGQSTRMAAPPAGAAASEPLFGSAHAALTFAFNHSAQVYDRPMMARLAATPRPGSSKGLGGTDGAGQAGMILANLDGLGDLHQLIICARFLPKTAECRCCGHHAWDADWLAVVRKISDLAMAAGVLSGHVVHRSVRDGLLVRYFAGKEGRDRIPLRTLAVKAGISERTVTDQNGKLTVWLRGTRLPKKGGAAAVVGEEQKAMTRIENALAAAGLIGAG